MKLTHLPTIAMFISIAPSCVEPYEVPTSSVSGSMVVEGQLTNLASGHYVILKYTTPLNVGDDFETRYETDANVMLIDQDGNSTTFVEEREGRYEAPTGFTGQVDNAYMLSITTDEGNRYQTDYQTLFTPMVIDSVYAQFTEIPDPSTGELTQGIQFFADSYGEDGGANYYRFEIEETHLIVVPHISLYKPVGGVMVPREKNIGVCYQTESSDKVILETTANLSVNRLSEIPIRFLPETNAKLRDRYSLKIRQLTIDVGAYNYYNRLLRNNESSGTLSDQQNGPVVGNVYNIDQPNELVLGYFEVAGVAEAREFFNPDFFGPGFDKPDFPYTCDINDGTSIVLSEQDAVNFLKGNPGMQAVLPSSPPGSNDLDYLIMRRTCTSCDWYASTEKPDFWLTEIDVLKQNEEGKP